MVPFSSFSSTFYFRLFIRTLSSSQNHSSLSTRQPSRAKFKKIPFFTMMAPVGISGILSSRLFLTLLSTLSFLLALILTFHYPRQTRSLASDASRVITTMDWMDPAHIPRPSTQGLGLNQMLGRRPMTIQRQLEKSEARYQKHIIQRILWLQEQGFGVRKFHPWDLRSNMFWWGYFLPAFNCPHEVERWGPINDGGKWMCGMDLYADQPRPKRCIIYSFGVDYDSRWEREVLDRTNCEIWAYDASVEHLGEATKGRPRIHFEKVFVGAENKIDEKGNVWKTLATIMEENGHDWIDILKVDIEGSEYDTFNALMDQFDPLPFSQLQIEIHVHKIPFDEFIAWWQRLEKAGLRAFFTEVNLNPVIALNQIPWASEYSFMNTKGGTKNLLIQDY